MTICPACTVFEMSPNVNVCDACWGREQSAHTIAQLRAELQNLRAAVRAADAMAGAVPTSSLCRLEDEHGENLMPFTDAIAAYREARRKCGEVT